MHESYGGEQREGGGAVVSGDVIVEQYAWRRWIDVQAE